MFYAAYMFSELRRRSGRTILTALGLALGVGLVVTVTALSAGLDKAQESILKPLTGVGTDMSVTRPISFDTSGNGGGGFPQLSDKERQQLQQENGPRRFGLQNLGEPGTKFSRDDFVAATQLSFADSAVSKIADLAGVASAVGGLTLNAIHVEGTVPEQTQQSQGGFRAGPQSGPQVFGPRNIDVTAITVSGVDERNKQLGAITPAQVTTGRYLASGDAREAVLDTAYAARNGLTVGETVKLGGKTFTVVGLAKTPLGGQASDVYVKLSQLQALSDRKGRVNTVYVRATSADKVGALARHIRSTVDGASVTTAKDLADRVSGSLVDAKNLAGKLGTALALVGLLAAFLIASLLTLSSVAKRVRELGTLKAVGWSQWRVVRQVSGEALAQGLLGGALGILLGLAGAAAISAFGPELHATFESAQSALPRFSPFGQGSVAAAGSTDVSLDAPVSGSLALLAVGLALLGGLVAGAVGGLRASRLRPADALRHLD
jgi:ABC-type antimicrobial peptide transport system permease subunit